MNLYYYPQKIKKAQKENEELKKKISSLENIESEFIKLKKLIEKKEKMLTNLDKKIVSKVTSAETYEYLNQILNYVGFIEFNLFYGGTEKQNGFGYNLYVIKGEAPFNRLYKFIWYIERGPCIYKIKKLNLRGVESKDAETGHPKLIIPFEMEIQAYFAEIEDLPSIHRTLRSVRVQKAINPFYPFILRNLPPNTENLIEIERAELKAIVPGKILVADYGGKIHVLKEGDPVYLGYLTKIDMENNQAIFTLNKGGVYEKFVLKLRFEKPIN